MASSNRLQEKLLSNTHVNESSFHLTTLLPNLFSGLLELII